MADHWQQLMLKMEDRLKLVNASVAFYKTSEQVFVNLILLSKSDFKTTKRDLVNYTFLCEHQRSWKVYDENIAAGWDDVGSSKSVSFCAMVECTVSSLSQVCSVLESLEQEYKREEDWCGGADKLGPNSDSDHVTPMISKHLEQKEAFLKVINCKDSSFPVFRNLKGNYY